MAPKRKAMPKRPAEAGRPRTALARGEVSEDSGEDGAMPAQELRNMHAHLAVMALKGYPAAKDFYKSLTTKSQKRAFFEQHKENNKRKSEENDKSFTVSDIVEVEEGWMSKPGP